MKESNSSIQQFNNSASKYNIADLQKMPLNELIAFVDLYKENTDKDQNLVQRIINPLIDRAKTIQDL